MVICLDLFNNILWQYFLCLNIFCTHTVDYSQEFPGIFPKDHILYVCHMAVESYQGPLDEF